MGPAPHLSRALTRRAPRPALVPTYSSALMISESCLRLASTKHASNVQTFTNSEPGPPRSPALAPAETTAADALEASTALELNRGLRVVLDVAPYFPRLLRRTETTDEVERHVNACRHTGGSNHIPVIDEALIGTRGDVAAER
jgi:hypothetical protein